MFILRLSASFSSQLFSRLITTISPSRLPLYFHIQLLSGAGRALAANYWAHSQNSYYSLECLSRLSQVQRERIEFYDSSSNIHHLLSVDPNNSPVIVNDDPKLPIFEPIKSNNNNQETSVRIKCENSESIKRYAGRHLYGSRPYDGSSQ
jgi:hypothetical protein